MDYQEAVAWLKGERSTLNHFYSQCTENENAEVCTAQADAARTQQAYWIVKAQNEGIISS